MTFEFCAPGVGDMAMFQTHAPVEPLKQRVIFRWFAARRIPRILVSYVIANWISRWRQDVKIWQGKIYRRNPPGVAVDDRLGRMRARFGQFCPDGFAEHPCEARDHGA